MTVKALLVIDIQTDNVKPNSPYPFPSEDVTGLIANTNKLITHWQQQEWPVFLIRQNYVGLIGKTISRLLLKGITIRGESGTELDPRLKADYGSIIDKTTQDSFYKTD
ncbi:MAG: isochorismatase family protein [Sneathiella sp.]|nr:isochorismatase family protein [Sneathiella sp.]